MVDPEEFSSLSREEQLKILEQKSWVKNIDFNPDSSQTGSLTGGKKAKWKFQDSFYGNFNKGRRPCQDTAWGRRVFDQYEIDVEMTKHRHSYINSGTESP